VGTSSEGIMSGWNEHLGSVYRVITDMTDG